MSCSHGRTQGRAGTRGRRLAKSELGERTAGELARAQGRTHSDNGELRGRARELRELETDAHSKEKRSQRSEE